MTLEEAFAPALLATPGSPAGASSPAFAIYRNTVIKGCVDALEANFPAVARLLGRDSFRAAAAAYAREHPPTQPSLLAYGDEAFGRWLLAQVAGGVDLPYLPGVARLDRLWREAHGAADALPADALRLAAMAPGALAMLSLRPHPAARWAWFEAGPAYTIWVGNRQDPVPRFDALAWRPEGALLTRPQGEVRWQALSRAGCVLLDACTRGAPLGEAAQAALDADPVCDLATLLPPLFAAGAFLHPDLQPD